MAKVGSSYQQNQSNLLQPNESPALKNRKVSRVRNNEASSPSVTSIRLQERSQRIGKSPMINNNPSVQTSPKAV